MDVSSIKLKLAELLKKQDIRISPLVSDKDALLNKLTMRIHDLIFNICALIATVALTHDKNNKQVLPSHIKSSFEHVKKQCYPSASKDKDLLECQKKIMKGGSYSIDSQYFGKLSDVYLQTSDHTTPSNINFVEGIARSELTSTMFGGSKDDETMFSELSIVISFVKPKDEIFKTSHIVDIFNQFNVIIKKNSIDIIKQILKMHLMCLLVDLKRVGNITDKKLDRVLKLARHSVFN